MKIVDAYYSIRKKLGLPPVNEERLRNYRALYPDRKPTEVAREDDAKLIKGVLLAFAGACFIIAALLVMQSKGSNIVYELERDKPGGGNKTSELIAEYDEDDVGVELTIKPRAYTTDEIDAIFDEAYEAMLAQFLNGNAGADKINAALNPTSSCPVADVDAKWQMNEKGIIDHKGELLDTERFAGGYETGAVLKLSFNNEKREYYVPLTFYPPEEHILTTKEIIESAVADADAANPYSDTVKLPDTILELPISFLKNSSGTSIAGVVLLAVILILLLIMRGKEQTRNEKKRRDEELEDAYPLFTSKLAVLIGAGLSLRRAWEKMVDDYHEDKKGRSALYEEMDLSLRSMKQGFTEEEALSKFGERIGLNSYLRLVGILESQRRNGRSELVIFLRGEARAALEKSLTTAKRRGEKISSRLLIPMMILFALVLALLILPALLSW